jgi:FkbM family methyltransferase
MKRVLHLVPHLSTGGCPQFAYDLVRKTKEYTDAYVVEYSFIAPDYVVQRNKVIELMGDRFFSINHNKEELIDLIARLNPDVIHFQEFPEYFMEDSIAEKIYRKERNYIIIETSHDSSFNPSQKRFFADHLALISQWQIDKFKSYGIPITLLQSDIEIYDEVDREVGLRNLGLDPEKEHVLNVGLWTSRKNQGEIVEYAKQLQESHPNIQFHFVGNQAGNFAHYWEPIMKDLPANCKVWGERSDVHNFYSCMDLFLFTSRGLHGDMETSPLVLREATGHGMPILMYNLPVYLNQYDEFENIDYLEFDDLESNLEYIKYMLGYESKRKTYSDLLMQFMGNPFEVAARYLNGELTEEELNHEPFKVGEPFMEEEKKSNFYSELDVVDNRITIFHESDEEKQVSISVADVDTKHAIYAFDAVFNGKSSVWVIPIPAEARDNLLNKSGLFRGYEISIYENDRKTLLAINQVFYNQQDKKINTPLFLTNPWNLTWFNYNEMFVDQIYKDVSAEISEHYESFVDIGANDGLFIEWLLSETKGFGKKYYAVECDPRAVKFLDDKFNDRDEVVVVNKALWKENAQGLTLNHEGDTSTLSSLKVDKSGKVSVDAWDLKTLKSKHNIKNIDFLKMDIEGAEYEVIDSWTKEDVKGIQIFLIEFHNNVPQNLVDKFLQWGYTVSPYDASCNEIEMYGIWVNEIQIPDHGFLTAINMH